MIRLIEEAALVTFGDLAQHYIKYELGDLADDQKSHTTVERYLQILNNRLIPRWGKIAALEIQPLYMQWLKASKREENLENPTVDKIRRVMNLVYKHGQTYGLIPRTEEANPMKFVRVKTQSEYEARIITPEQGFKILTAMPQPERTLTLLIAATGLPSALACSGQMWTTIASRFPSVARGRAGKLASQRGRRARLRFPWSLCSRASFASGSSRRPTVNRPIGSLRARGLGVSSPASLTCWSKIISARQC